MRKLRPGSRGDQLSDYPVNMPNQTPRDWRKQAELCRRFAEGTTDRLLTRRLLDLAEEFEVEAEEANDQQA